MSAASTKELARQTNLGSRLLVLNDDEIIQLLRAAVEREGNQIAFARRHGIDRASLNMMLNGKRPVSPALMNALGLRKVHTPE